MNDSCHPQGKMLQGRNPISAGIINVSLCLIILCKYYIIITLTICMHVLQLIPLQEKKSPTLQRNNARIPTARCFLAGNSLMPPLHGSSFSFWHCGCCCYFRSTVLLFTCNYRSWPPSC